MRDVIIEQPHEKENERRIENIIVSPDLQSFLVEKRDSNTGAFYLRN